MNKRQVIVVGAGPSGSIAAFYLAKAGVDVLMMDRETFPRDKPCGDVQFGSIFSVYKDMGIFDEVTAVANPGRGLTFFDKNSDRCDLYTDYVEEYIIPRRIIDNITCRAAVKAGAELWEDCDARELIVKKNAVKGVRAVFRGKPVEVYADIVVIAQGSHSMLARQVGIFKEDPDLIHYGARCYYENIGEMKKDHIEAHYIKELAPNGYIWLCPTGEGRANVGVFANEATLRREGRKIEDYIDFWVKNYKTGRARLGNARQIGKLQGWRIPTSKKIEKNYVAGAVVVGDSSNNVESWQGEGYVQAATCGAAAGHFIPSVLEGGDFSEEALAPFQKLCDEQLGDFMAQSAALRKYLFTDPENIVKAFDMFRALPEYPNLSLFDAFEKYLSQAMK